jgi:hypothetical protein
MRPVLAAHQACAVPCTGLCLAELQLEQSLLQNRMHAWGCGGGNRLGRQQVGFANTRSVLKCFLLFALLTRAARPVTVVGTAKPITTTLMCDSEAGTHSTP